MKENLNLLALDLGAESGRAILGSLAGDQLTLEEVHRFANEPVHVGAHLYWDFPGLLREIKKGIRLAHQKAGRIDGLAVDTWGVDYGLLDGTGELLGNPVHYRDRRIDNILPLVFSKIDPKEIYRQTGIQVMSINTSCQLAALKKENPDLLDWAQDLLFMPGLITYFLSGIKANDTTITSTSQLYNPVNEDWAFDMIDKLSLPKKLFKPVIKPVTILGGFAPQVAKELGLDTKVIAIGGHDTASAVAAVPALEERFAYISCGTWSLIGTELPGPLINDQAQSLNFTNEVGVENRIRLLKNVIGLWILQQCRQSWAKKGVNYDYVQLSNLAASAEPWRTIIDPDEPDFLNPSDMCEAITNYAKKTGQPVPETTGAVVRCILESLALKYWWVIERLQELTGSSFNNIHMVGGGTKNEFLCQLAADVTGRPVVSGPVEATAIGNVLTQALALGRISDLAELRRVVQASFPPKTYQPSVKPEATAEVKQKFLRLINQGTF
jgi:rhamnulokinase